jgi:amino acid adenylation domain-containing protein
MSDFTQNRTRLPPEQEAIRAKCFHPTGTFVEFKKEEVEQSIPDRFEKIVAKYPERIAVKTKNQVITYKELNEAANRMAGTILASQEQKREPVALLFEHGAQAITAILGVLKAGRFYVPLDPTFPVKRIVSILEDSRAQLLVTNSRHVGLAKRLMKKGSQILDLDRPNSKISTRNLSLAVSSKALAAVMYTSGSTGQPKGVVHNHRNLLHWAMVQTNNLHICPRDRLTLLQSCTIPSCIHNLFGALLNGASLFPFNPRLGGLQLARWLIDEEITIYHSVVMVFRQMTDALTGREAFDNLRVIRLSGMAVNPRDVALYKKYFSSDCILVHVLGTTEAGTIPHYFIDKAHKIPGTAVPVGYAAQDAEILLLDDNGSEVSVEETGEIAVKSQFVSAGYWRKPELTKTKFLRDPEDGRRRIYLTGDLGRMAPDGCLFHLGRRDFQANVRGYRIETDEVESALLDHAAVKEVAVIARPDQNGDSCLLAYFVPAKEPRPSVGELRSFLDDRLPQYMIPATFMALHSLPLTPSGKVDRRALPEPGNRRPDLDTRFVAPRTPVEAELSQIWAEVLCLQQVGIHDPFFDLSGHSLAATRVISQVIKRFGLELPLQFLFAAPTVVQMAVVITEHRGKKLEEKELNRILTELESLSEDDAHRLLSDPSKTASTED